MNNPPVAEADLITINNKIYHLDISCEELADYIILVGDPHRTSYLSQHFFNSEEVNREHRGLRTITGILKGSGLRCSLVTSGMGTPSLEIVLNELALLASYDLNTRQILPEEKRRKLTIIRLGTSGGIQTDTPLGTCIVSTFALGMDNAGLFIEPRKQQEKCKNLEISFQKFLNSQVKHQESYARKIAPYASQSSAAVVAALLEAGKQKGISAIRTGITCSHAGFFHAQGRSILPEVTASIPDVDQVLCSFGFEDLRIENFEMESSFLFLLCTELGYPCASICPTIAHRPSNRFASAPQESTLAAARLAFQALEILAQAT